MDERDTSIVGVDRGQSVPPSDHAAAPHMVQSTCAVATEGGHISEIVECALDLIAQPDTSTVYGRRLLAGAFRLAYQRVWSRHDWLEFGAMTRRHAINDSGAADAREFGT